MDKPPSIERGDFPHNFVEQSFIRQLDPMRIANVTCLKPTFPFRMAKLQCAIKGPKIPSHCFPSTYICVAIVHSVLDIAVSLAFTHHPQISLSSCLCIRLKSKKIDTLLSNACSGFYSHTAMVPLELQTKRFRSECWPFPGVRPCHLCTCSHTRYSTCEAKRLHFMRRSYEGAGDDER